MYLGIDIGTSAVKAVIVNDEGSVVSQASAPLTVSRPKELWSEQDPAEWWSATNMAVCDLDPKARSAVNAVGLSGQMHGATLLDDADRAIRPAILWNDGRSHAECTLLAVAEPAMTGITGNLAMPGFTAPKLLWVSKNEPSAFERVRKVLLPKDYVRLRMTGDYATDMSDAAGTLWLDVGARAWSSDMLAACDLATAHMPALFEGPEATGRLRAEIAEAWGMQRAPVAAGGGDNAAGAVGAGVYRAGDGFISLGTSGVTFLADDAFRPNPEGAVHTFCHALPGKWHQMAVMLSAASAIDWVAHVTGFASAALLHDAVAGRNAVTRGEIFLPYLSGERTPHNDPLAKGAFFGLSHDTDPTALAQAALEGVAFGIADGVDAILAAGATINTLSVIGGGARSSYWGRIIASALGRPLAYRKQGAVGPAYGAARLARLCISGESVEDVCAPPEIEAVIEPSPAFVEPLAERRAKFQALYRQTKALL